jgi:hypothetical protein
MSWRVVATLVLTAWGALAFGAVYSWAFLPLFAASTAVGGATFLQRSGPGKTEVLLAAALALLLAAVGLQLVPVSASSIRWIGPETDVILRRCAVGYPRLKEAYPCRLSLAQRCSGWRRLECGAKSGSPTFPGEVEMGNLAKRDHRETTVPLSIVWLGRVGIAEPSVSDQSDSE